MAQKQKTAVGWLIEQLDDVIDWDWVDGRILEQAKQMEKEHLMKAFDDGYFDYYPPQSEFGGSSETYYNETFNP